MVDGRETVDRERGSYTMPEVTQHSSMYNLHGNGSEVRITGNPALNVHTPHDIWAAGCRDPTPKIRVSSACGLACARILVALPKSIDPSRLLRLSLVDCALVNTHERVRVAGRATGRGNGDGKDARRSLAFLCEALVALPSLPFLEVLDLRRNRLRRVPVRELANSEKTPRLEVLDLKRNWVMPGKTGISRKNGSGIDGGNTLPAGLHELDLRFNEALGAPGVLTLLAEQLLLHSCDASAVTEGPAHPQIIVSPWGQKAGFSPATRDARDLRAQLEALPTPELRRRVRLFEAQNGGMLRVEGERGAEQGGGTAQQGTPPLGNLERAGVMARLLAFYPSYSSKTPPGEKNAHSVPCRAVEDLSVRGVPVSYLRAELLDRLKLELQRWAGSYGPKPKQPRERPSISAEHYMILRREDLENDFREAPCEDHTAADADKITNPCSEGKKTKAAKTAGIADRVFPKGGAAEAGTLSWKRRRGVRKLRTWRALYDLAFEVLKRVDPEFARERFDQLAVTHNFRGSPHIDRQNTGPFCALSLGNFRARSSERASENGREGPAHSAQNLDSFCGGIFVEHATDPLHRVCYADTFEHLCKLEGRRVHWVAPWDEWSEGGENGENMGHKSGDRFSLIFYQTKGVFTPVHPTESVLWFGKGCNDTVQ